MADFLDRRAPENETPIGLPHGPGSSKPESSPGEVIRLIGRHDHDESSVT